MDDTTLRQLARRQFFRNSACGFGSLALGGLLADTARAERRNPLAVREPMFAPRAKRVIFIFMQGGPSHVDSFDPKPELIARHGQTIDFTGVRADTFGKASKRKLMKPLWKFRNYGECGAPVSELFPHIAQHVDDLCFIKSMKTEGVAHGPSTLFMHTGAMGLVRPSIGSWVTYGLGTENANMPGFVTIQPSSSKGGPRNYANAFLPAVYQGTAIGRAGQSTKDATIEHITNKHTDAAAQAARFRFLQQMNREQIDRRGPVGDFDSLEATIDSYELAHRMQTHAPDVLDVSGEPTHVLDMYGIGNKTTDNFGRQCLMARRLAEADVRYIQLNYSDESPNPRWDQHSNMPKHMDHARATDKPVAGLLADLKQRGLLEDTLVWWGGEFGRTPFSQGANGRDHNPRGFSVFLAGGGVKPGHTHGSTDDIGLYADDSPVHMHDLHATILHLLGMDHEELTYRYAGRDFRLTDVHGNVVHDIIA